MKILRGLALLLAILMIAMGLLWVGQGTGHVMWPEASFMLADKQWAINGAVLAAAGLIFAWIAVRRA
jgi:uncharacterized membrane protein YciS (DUF1049 family)